MKRRQHGITLIELMIVVVIVGVLAAIAVPSYRAYVIRANRADAKTQLLQTAQQLERCYTNSTPYAYNGANCNAAVTFPVATEGGNYIITAPARTATTFSLLATRAGTQVQDARCGDLTLTHTGIEGVTGAAPVAECWRR